jgi:hypothetical protein
MLSLPQWAAAAVSGPPELFAQDAFLPEGVAVDATGNVHVYHDALGFKAVSRFLPDGSRDALIPIGGFFFNAVGGRLIAHPQRDTLLLLLSTGEVLEVTPGTGAVSSLLDLRALELDAGAVFDLPARQVRDLLGVIVPSVIQYGDVAAHPTDGGFDLFVSGISLNTPFVARVRVTPQGAGAVQVLVASAGNPAPTHLTRGVAVNADGTVLTTLPLFALGAPALQDHVVAFSAAYAPADPAATPPMAVLGANIVKSRGMTADRAGTFYIATDARGTTACGLGRGGSLVAIPPDLGSLSCHDLTLGPAEPSDVAVAPADDRLYLTATRPGVVMVFPLDASLSAGLGRQASAAGH